MKKSLFRRVFDFYYDGFCDMTVGRSLWLIILLKLFIMFVVLKLFFFPNTLAKYDTTEEKSKAVIEELTNPK